MEIKQIVWIIQSTALLKTARISRKMPPYPGDLLPLNLQFKLIVWPINKLIVICNNILLYKIAAETCVRVQFWSIPLQHMIYFLLLLLTLFTPPLFDYQKPKNLYLLTSSFWLLRFFFLIVYIFHILQHFFLMAHLFFWFYVSP